MATQRNTVLRNPRTEDHQRISFHQFVERITHRTKCAIRQPLNCPDNELDRPFQDSAVTILIRDQLQCCKHILVIIAVGIQVVDQQPDARRCRMGHERLSSRSFGPEPTQR